MGKYSLCSRKTVFLLRKQLSFYFSYLKLFAATFWQKSSGQSIT